MNTEFDHFTTVNSITAVAGDVISVIVTGNRADALPGMRLNNASGAVFTMRDAGNAGDVATISIWDVVVPVGGTYPLYLEFTGLIRSFGILPLVITGIDNTTPVRDSSNASDFGATPGVAVTSVVGDEVIGGVATQGATAAPSSGSAGHDDFNSGSFSGTTVLASTSYQTASGTTTTPAWTLSAGDLTTRVGVSYIPATGGSTVDLAGTLRNVVRIGGAALSASLALNGGNVRVGPRGVGATLTASQPLGGYTRSVQRLSGASLSASQPLGGRAAGLTRLPGAGLGQSLSLAGSSRALARVSGGTLDNLLTLAGTLRSIERIPGATLSAALAVAGTMRSFGRLPGASLLQAQPLFGGSVRIFGRLTGALRSAEVLWVVSGPLRPATARAIIRAAAPRCIITPVWPASTISQSVARAVITPIEEAT